MQKMSRIKNVLCHSRNLFLWMIVLSFILLFAGMDSIQAEERQYEEAYLLPPEFVQDILNRDRHYDMLNTLSPDAEHFLIPIQQYFSSLELMAQRTMRLAMLEFCPDVNREWRLSTYGIKGLKIYSLRKRRSWAIDLPEGIFVSDMMWSPDGRKIAFLAHLREGTQVWVADVESGRAEPVSKAYVMATLTARPRWRRARTAPSQMLQWTPDGSILTLLIPEDRGSEPEKNLIPGTPIIRKSRKKPTPTRTYPFLLRTPHDKDLFRYYTTSQLALLTPGELLKKIGQPAMFMSISLSPDGKYILAEKMVEPFSYIVGYNGFPRELQVIDLDGKVLSTIRKVPLQEAMGRDRGRRVLEDLPRDVAWRPDGKGLSFLWREKKKKEEKDSDMEGISKRKDRLMFLPPPFDMSRAQALVSTEKRISNVSYSLEGRYAFATLTETEGRKRRQEIVAYDLRRKKPRKFVLIKDIDPDDVLRLPGEILTRRTANGIVYTLLSRDRRSVYLQGPGYREDFKPRPFIDRVAITSGRKVRIFEGSSEMYERPLVPLDEDMNRLIISRESLTVFPDCYLWKKDGTAEKLTQNQDPFPEVAGCRRIDFEFFRRDGLKIYGRISLPVDYKEGTRV
ncbi:MAG: hypothetical protein ACE5L7_08750, partial [Candidatus Aminicenantales bacterium]